MQAAVEAARGDSDQDEADEGPITEPIPKVSAQIPPAKTHEGAGSPSASRGRVVEFKRPAKRHRGQSASKAQRAGQSKSKHGGADPAKSAPQTRQQASAAPEARDAQQAPAAPAASQARDAQQAPAAPAASQARDAQQAPAAPAKPDASAPSAQLPSGSSPVGTAPPPLPKRRPAESTPAATRSDRDTAAAAPPANPKDAPPRVLGSPAGPSAAGTVPPTPAEDVLTAAAEPPVRTVPTLAADRAALVRAASHIPNDLREPRRAGPRLGSDRARRVTGIAASMVIVLAVGGIAIALAARSAPGNSNNSPKINTLHRQELANTTKAVDWIDDQVSPTSVIACDPATCAAIQAHGYPAAELQVLKPTTPYPRKATLVVETGSVRGIYGTSLRSDWAPAVLTRIGTGAAEIEIRVIAPDGAAAYRQALASDLANRKQDSSVLLNGTQVAMSKTARARLVSGAVDWRLVLAIAKIAGEYPVDIIEFGNDAVGASPGLPLRYADLSEQVRAPGMTGQTYLAAMAAALDQLPVAYRPLHTQSLRLPRGGEALRVEFGAPTPPNLLGPTGG
jgi:hypothetical protein